MDKNIRIEMTGIRTFYEAEELCRKTIEEMSPGVECKVFLINEDKSQELLPFEFPMKE